MFVYPAIPIASQHDNFRYAASKFMPLIDQLV